MIPQGGRRGVGGERWGAEGGVVKQRGDEDKEGGQEEGVNDKTMMVSQ